MKANTLYSVTIKGQSAGPVRLYLFIDYHSCGATPAAEHTRTSGEIWDLPRGKFTRTAKGWHSSLKREDHACTYLHKLIQPVNASGESWRTRSRAT